MSSKASAPVDTPAPKRRTGLIVGLLAVLLIGCGGGAAAWVMTRPAADADAFDAGEARRSAKDHIPIFVPLEQFTVNLADLGGERLAQVGVTLEVADARTETAAKAHMPAVRNSILLLLSASESAELLTVAGKKQLASRIAELTGRHLGWQPPPEAPAGTGAGTDTSEFVARRPAARQQTRPNPIEAVHFSHFIVQ